MATPPATASFTESGAPVTTVVAPFAAATSTVDLPPVSASDLPENPDVPASPEPIEPKTQTAPDPDLIVLDRVVITADREDPLVKQLRTHDQEARTEETFSRKTRTGVLSRLFNSWNLPLFGGNMTADRLAEGANRRGEILDQERILLVALQYAKTDDERRALKADLANLRALRRAMVATDPRPWSP